MIPHIGLCLLLLVLALAVVHGDCPPSDKEHVKKCLRTFFTDTEQEIPAGLEQILSQGKRRKKRDYNEESRGGSYSPEAQPFLENWCGAFKEQVSCLKSVSCPLSCHVLTSFSNLYGTRICDTDISGWVSTHNRSCEDFGSGAGSRDAGWLRPLLMVSGLFLLVL